MTWLGNPWHALTRLLRDLVGRPYDEEEGADAEAQVDDVLDAALDDDGVDATGL